MLCLIDNINLNTLAEENLVMFVTNADTVKNIMSNEEWESHIYHQSNADLLSELLEMKIDVNKEPINIDRLSKFDVFITFNVERLKNEYVVIFYIIPTFSFTEES